MNIALDIVSVVLIIAFFIGGYKKGIINMFLSLASSITALVGACFAACYLSEPVYNLFLKETVIEKISNALLMGNDKEGFYTNLPESLSIIIKKIDLSNSVISDGGVEAATIIESATAPVIQMLISCAILLLSFIFISLVLKPVQKLLNGLFKLPVIGLINKLLGGSLGIIEGILFLIVVCVAMRVWLPYSLMLQKLLTPDNVNLTLLFSHIFNSEITDYLCEFFTQFKFSGGLNLA